MILTSPSKTPPVNHVHTEQEKSSNLKWNDPELLGQYLADNFTFIDQIGEGAMGKIHLVIENNLQRKIAFKTLHEDIASDPSILNRFLNEVQITAQLDHPNIVPVYGLVYTDSGLAYSMKLIKGNTLKDVIEEVKVCFKNNKERPQHLQLATLLEHFLKLCDAVEFAHSKRVLHRDLKPENVMIGPYHEVYLMDWGIAKVIAPMSEEEREQLLEKSKLINMVDITMNMTSYDDLLGTPAYMSPEQIMDPPENLDFTSDVYALGIILYELVCLKPAFQAKTIGELLNKVIAGERSSVESLISTEVIPFELKAIIEKATKCDSTDRYASVKELANDIRRYMRGEEILARPDTYFQKVLRWISHHRQTTLIAIMSISIVSSLLVSYSFYRQYKDYYKAQLREEKLAHLLNLVSSRSQLINAKLLEFESITTSFATAIEQRLEYAEMSDHPYFVARDHLNGHQPGDLKVSRIYREPVSLDSHVFRIFPGVKREDVEPLIKKFSDFTPYLNRLLLTSYQPQAITFDPIKAEDLIRNQGVLLILASVGFEEGFGFLYPGRVRYNPEYDSRQRPWYTIAKNKMGTVWGYPYLDSGGIGWVVPSSKALYDSKKKFRGVVGLDMHLKAIRGLMDIHETPSIKDVYLVNAQGQVLIRGSQKDKEYQAGTLINRQTKFPLFKVKQVVTAIQNGQKSGYIRQSEQLFSFHQLSSTRWYYVVESFLEN